MKKHEREILNLAIEIGACEAALTKLHEESGNIDLGNGLIDHSQAIQMDLGRLVLKHYPSLVDKLVEDESEVDDG